MEGQRVLWFVPSENNNYKPVNIYAINKQTDTYDIILDERNVPMENIYVTISDSKPKVDDIVLYKKKNKIHEAIICKLDYVSNSVQVKIIVRDVHYSLLFNESK